MMGVAFAIVMRTERMAARAYADSVRAKQMLQVGLARALSDLNANLGNEVYPNWDILYQTSDKSGGNQYGMVDTVEPGSFIPRSLWAEANRVTPTNNSDSYKGTITVPDHPYNPAGRYSYLIFNCSGLLDGNYIGGMSRSTGTNSNEITLSGDILGEIGSMKSTNFVATRNAFTRFESVSEMWGLLFQTNIANNLPASGSENLFAYSRAPGGLFDGSVVLQPVFVGGTNFDQQAVRDAFQAMGVGLPTTLLDQFIDYTDGNFIPNNLLTTQTTEPTPLVNELIIEQRMVDATNMLIQPKLELWYPFVGVNNTFNYEVAIRIVFTNDPDKPEYNPKNTAVPGQYIAVTPVSGPWSSPRFEVLNLPPVSVSHTSPPVSFAHFTATNISVIVRQVSGSVKTLVDSVTNVPFSLSFSQTTPGAAVSGGIAVTDPRLNHVPTQWSNVHASAAAITMGSINSVTDPAAGDGSAARDIYIANRPLRSTGELGLLFAFNEPWKTFQLLGTNALPVYDFFTVSTNSISYGRVNINSPNASVVDSVFLGVRADIWPEQPAATVLGVTDVDDWSDALFSGRIYTNSITHVVKTNYSNVGDIRFNYRLTNVMAGLSGLEREGVIRNTLDLFTTRQQLFTILLSGEYLDASTNVAALSRAVAVVWRDPFPRPDPDDLTKPIHDTYVRFFKWIGVAGD